MNQEEQDRLEAALRQIAPAPAPPDLLNRLRAAPTAPPPAPAAMPDRFFTWEHMRAFARGLMYGAAVGAVLLLFWFAWHPTAPAANPSPPALAGIKPNAVQVGHVLLASFDAIAQLPDGTPVRFRCREWQDDVVVRDHADGMVVSRSTPRLEVVPVRFEIY